MASTATATAQDLQHTVLSNNTPGVPCKRQSMALCASVTKPSPTSRTAVKDAPRECPTATRPPERGALFACAALHTPCKEHHAWATPQETWQQPTAVHNLSSVPCGEPVDFSAQTRPAGQTHTERLTGLQRTAHKRAPHTPCFCARCFKHVFINTSLKPAQVA